MKANGKVRWATEEDVPRVWELILELAEYERAADQVRINAEVLGRDGFGENPGYGLLVLEPADRDEVVGMALFYEKYSTWNGSNGIPMAKAYPYDCRMRSRVFTVTVRA